MCLGTEIKAVKQAMFKKRNKPRLYLQFQTVLQNPTVNCKIMCLDFSHFQPKYTVVSNFRDSKVRSQLTDVRLASYLKMKIPM
jgi:excinuclease UvrABC nuclease subunit